METFASRFILKAVSKLPWWSNSALWQLCCCFCRPKQSYLSVLFCSCVPFTSPVNVCWSHFAIGEPCSDDSYTTTTCGLTWLVIHFHWIFTMLFVSRHSLQGGLTCYGFRCLFLFINKVLAHQPQETKTNRCAEAPPLTGKSFGSGCQAAHITAFCSSLRGPVVCLPQKNSSRRRPSSKSLWFERDLMHQAESESNHRSTVSTSYWSRC